MEIKGIYVVTDEHLMPGRTHADIVRAAIGGGAGVVQVRDKHSDDRYVLEACLEIRKMTRQAGVLFIVNNRIDIACACDADGVHLGQSDLPIEYARRILGPKKVVGLSAVTFDEAVQAKADGAHYIGYGPVFPTSTKLDAAPVTGLDELKAVCELGVPVVAIGGIDETNVAKIKAAGAGCASVVSAVVCKPDMTEATRRLVELFGGF